MRILERIDDVALCSDCVYMVANGEVPDRGPMPRTIAHGIEAGAIRDDDAHLYNSDDDDDRDENASTRHAEKMGAQWPTDDPASWWELCLGDDEAEFSSRQCDGCGTRLAGTRNYGSALLLCEDGGQL